eukprot:TRINITY_DN1018_c0_g1_i2.p1 TRINITY_DN1018_c0_g1~~TRINITY_DN1018_c0_g1_i2.p1  ORF type:complete len:310 (-),score=95.59 TRINITY_DN1018_c0_g1_i2:100-1029(-)
MTKSLSCAVALLVLCAVVQAVPVDDLLIRLGGDMVMTPLGPAPASCVHTIEDGSHIMDSDSGASVRMMDGSVWEVPACRDRARPQPKTLSAQPDGWQAWTSFNNANNATFTSFLGQFNVPQAPSKFGDFGGILYMFTGLQNVNWVPAPPRPPAPPGFDIIQPVLQYGGGSSGGGGKYWAVASWYVTLDNSFLISQLKKVQPGDAIFGNMTKTGTDTWFVGSQIVSSKQTTNLSVTRPRLSSQPWAYCTLEVYDVDCDWFPPASSPITFSNMVLGDASGSVTPKWDTHTGDNPCKTSIKVASPSEVTITF